MGVFFLIKKIVSIKYLFTVLSRTRKGRRRSWWSSVVRTPVRDHYHHLRDLFLAPVRMEGAIGLLQESFVS